MAKTTQKTKKAARKSPAQTVSKPTARRGPTPEERLDTKIGQINDLLDLVTGESATKALTDMRTRYFKLWQKARKTQVALAGARLREVLAKLRSADQAIDQAKTQVAKIQKALDALAEAADAMDTALRLIA